MANLNAAEADAEYLRILGDLHRFAHATGARPGCDVVKWFLSVGVGLREGPGLTASASPSTPGTENTGE